MQQANGHFGRLDVVVNNAGYGHFGYVEELTESEARAQLDTDLFGALWVSQAAIPLLRAQGGAHIVQISCVGGVLAIPGIGIYHASKWALEGLSEALAQETAGFGIKVTIVEPGGYGIDWAGSSATHSQINPLYQPLVEAMAAGAEHAVTGEPAGVANAVLAVVDADNPPLRLIAGSPAYDLINEAYTQQLHTWHDWETTSRDADHAWCNTLLYSAR